MKPRMTRMARMDKNEDETCWMNSRPASKRNLFSIRVIRVIRGAVFDFRVEAILNSQLSTLNRF